MNTGDTLTDSQGGSWVVDALLGRGSWGRTWALRGDGGATAVLKTPLTATDFPLADDPVALVKASAQVLEAQRQVLHEGRISFYPRLRATAALPHAAGGLPNPTALVLERYDADLESRLAGGIALSDVLDLCTRLMNQLTHGTQGGEVHGNLRPSNIFLDAHGRPVLTDPVVPAVASLQARLARHAPNRLPYTPPHATDRPDGSWDTWAVCLILYRAAVAAGSSDDPRRGALADLPREGLGRVALAALKDTAATRLRSEASNKRFSARATERLGAVLNRGLSIEAEPSPPFRFRTSGDLLPRLIEVDDLVHPTVDSVSKVMLSPDAAGEVYEGVDHVDFSINVGTSSGVTQEDLACGVQVQDLDAPGDGRVRIRNSRFDVKRYPSGRWRYNFVLPDVPPGRYAVRVAFMIKDSEDPPKIAEGQFEVRPRPGYVPPPAPADQPPPPLTLPRAAPRADGPSGFGSPGYSPPSYGAPEDDAASAPGTVVPFPIRGDAPAAPVLPGGYHNAEPHPDHAGARDLPPAADATRPSAALHALHRAPEQPHRGPTGPVVSAHDAPYARPPEPHTGYMSPVPPTASVQLPPIAPPISPPIGPPINPPPAPPPPSRLTPRGVAGPASPGVYPPGPDPRSAAAYDPLDDLPSPSAAAHLPELHDPMLHDYPPPLPQGSDLPSYDDDLRTGPASGFDALRNRIATVFERDPYSAFMAFAGSSFVILVLVVALARSC
jgi:hypothetical protein